MKQVKFGIRFTVNDYAYGELDNFIECAENLGGEQNLTQRYHAFLHDVTFKKVKPSTLVGGKMFLGRYNALVKTHGATISCDL